MKLIESFAVLVELQAGQGFAMDFQNKSADFSNSSAHLFAFGEFHHGWMAQLSAIRICEISWLLTARSAGHDGDHSCFGAVFLVDWR